MNRSEPHVHRASRGQKGFTLLELLLATAIGAIVLLVINSTFFAALRLHNTTHEKIDHDLVLQRTLGIVRKDLAGVMIPANPQATTYRLSGQLVSDSVSTNSMDNVGERISPDIVPRLPLTPDPTGDPISIEAPGDPAPAGLRDAGMAGAPCPSSPPSTTPVQAPRPAVARTSARPQVAEERVTLLIVHNFERIMVAVRANA